MAETFALGIPSHPGKVQLWCSYVRVYARGTIRFSVINGGWEGLMDADKTSFKIDYGNGVIDHESKTCVFIWEGYVPKELSKGWDAYNNVIPWIENEIKEGRTRNELSPMEQAHEEIARIEGSEEDEIPF